MGGEKAAASTAASSRPGSPPRRRGKGLRRHQQDRGPGITPAWAGKSRCRSRPGNTGWDHPRVGGEKQSRTLANARPRGSPPRGRGKVPQAAMKRRFLGITPAWAGKSWRASNRTERPEDHPRVGGEKHGRTEPRRRRRGSPPRGRGKAGPTAIVNGVGGITPAWAGKRPESRPRKCT